MKNKDKQLDFTDKNIYVGLDTHLKTWKVTVLVEDIFFKTFSQEPIAEVLYKYLTKNFPKANYFSAYEASFSGFSAHRLLIKLGVNNIVVNPADIPTTDKERRQKDDARDSKKIAQQLSASNLTGIYVPSIESEGDRSLLRLRRTYVKEIARNKNRTKSFLYYHGIEIPEKFFQNQYWSKAFMTWLKEIEMPIGSAKDTITEIIDLVEFLRNKQLHILKRIKILAETDRYKKNVKLLISIPGIGLITAMSFLTEIETILRFDNIDKFCSFVGLIPSTNSSGEHESVGSITNRKNKILRSLIIESAWVAIRQDAALMLAYSELVKRMKPTNAIIRIAKKC